MEHALPQQLLLVHSPIQSPLCPSTSALASTGPSPQISFIVQFPHIRRRCGAQRARMPREFYPAVFLDDRSDLPLIFLFENNL